MTHFWLLDDEQRRTAFEQAGALKGWLASSVEKDYWVYYTLRHLFNMPELAGHLTFKGGTSLSKAWRLIERFSEDIDLTIGRELLGYVGDKAPEQAKTSSQQGKLLKALRKAAGEYVRNTVFPSLAERIKGELGTQAWKLSLDAEDPDQQTILFEYPTVFENSVSRYLRPRVKIEFGARADPWPASTRAITPVVGEIIDQLSIPSVEVKALAAERTFWEKAMLLHEERFRPPEKVRGARMARHYYDVYCLIQKGVAAAATADLTLFSQVSAHRQVFFEQSWVDYTTLKPDSLEIMPTTDQYKAWEQDYVAMQAEMFSESPPAFDVILSAVQQFQSKFRDQIDRQAPL
ncbi:nucleotidyl transferase AbiEii/AbiGii toxin family protein [Pseudoduganella sp. FT93W]|uniref:Nucleotidyl transferase AbiEii/AbiGii toxin family protein n=1 Tax=Duganella fentianensis TaxID=2692177 RepID=A0A845I2R4_9BURK|nr:nucleotidyl transferase AbiEii/AbiGii toxin family protein [Duganella fentianensis]MYN46085.1 nucleotidyl transferase AbiEii/AbiGii toxin family protein [Duganella fentianensis]